MAATTHPVRFVLRAAVIYLNLWIMSAGAESEKPALVMQQQTIADAIIFKRALYDYAPAVIRDGNLYRLYWCGGVAGDFILYAESSNPRGPWHSSRAWQSNSYDVSLRPTGSPANFDGLHTCDPNVIKVGSNYFLYYTGASADGALGAIGVAGSGDGIHFTRLNGGLPIVSPARSNPDYARNGLTYGAGQPAVLYRDGYFYLSFTDSTGSGVNPGNGAGQFLLRSKDPSFQTMAQEWTRAGWAERASGKHTAEFSYLESFGLDWMFDAPTHQIIVASDRTSGKTDLYLLDPDSFAVRGAGALPTQWREGPALIAQSDRTTLPRPGCDIIQIGVIVAEGPKPDPWTWDLGLSMANFKISPCAGAP